MSVRGWKKVRVGNLGRIVTGKTPKTSIKDNYGGQIPFITPSDDMVVKYIKTTNKTLTMLGLKEVKNCILPPNSVCVSCIGSDLGKVVITAENTVSNQQINSIILNEELYCKDFVYYAMIILGKELNHISKISTAVPIVNKTNFSNYEISVPLIKTQKQIAKVLSALDDKIELNNKINDNLEEQAQALYNNQFAKLDKNGKLKDIIYEYSKSKINVSKAKGVIGDYPFYTSGRAILQYPTYLVSGRNCYLNTGGNADVKFHIGKASYSTDTWCITGTNYLSDYLYLLLSSIKKELNNKYFEGSALKHLQKNNLRDRKIYIPSHNQILKFNKLVYPIFDCIMKNTKENRKLAQLRDTLLPRLMCGKIDVSKVEI